MVVLLVVVVVLVLVVVLVVVAVAVAVAVAMAVAEAEAEAEAKAVSGLTFQAWQGYIHPTKGNATYFNCLNPKPLSLSQTLCSSVCSKP